MRSMSRGRRRADESSKAAAGTNRVAPNPRPSGAYDALFASLIARASFEVVYLTGSGVSYSRLAAPDIELVTASEMVRKVWEIAGAVDIPVIADADNGYGDPANVRRVVREYERAGAAAIRIEDQNFPKRCGHYAGKTIVPIDGDAGAHCRSDGRSFRRGPSVDRSD